MKAIIPKPHTAAAVPASTPDPRGRGGFSLMEVLVSLAVLAVVSTVGATMLIKMTDAWRTVHTRVDIYRAGDQFLEQFREDLSRLVSAEMSGTPLHGAPGAYVEADAAHPLYDVPRVVDQIALPVEEPIDGLGNTRRFMVQYAMDNNVTPPVLVRSTQPLVRASGTAPEEASDVDISEEAAITDPDGAVVLEGAIALRFEYYDGAQPPSADGAWTTTWDAERHPSAIRVSLVMANPNRLDQQVSRQATYFTAVQ